MANISAYRESMKLLYGGAPERARLAQRRHEEQKQLTNKFVVAIENDKWTKCLVTKRKEAEVLCKSFPGGVTSEFDLIGLTPTIEQREAVRSYQKIQYLLTRRLEVIRREVYGIET